VRRRGNWIDAYINETERLSAPLINRKWAAITAISGAMERKLWTISRGEPIFPNLFTVIVGPPGVGKTVAISLVEDLWRDLKLVHVAKSQLTRASMMDQLAKAERKGVHEHNHEPYSFHSLLVISKDLQTLLPKYEADFMGMLQELYDCKSISEQKRTREIEHNIPNPHLVILGATTTSYLTGLFAEEAWEQGLAARVIFIYSDEILYGDIFTEHKSMAADLLHDLSIINDLSGPMIWDEDVKKAYTTWYKSGMPPRPNHPKLIHYNTRRNIQVMKLAMIASIAESNDKIVRMHHYIQALNWLLEAEHLMPEIFKNAQGGDHKCMEECWHYALRTFLDGNKRPLMKSLVKGFLSRRTSIMNVDRLYAAMVEQNMIKEIVDKDGPRVVPNPREGV
jgi:hypothetical protein